MQQMQQSLWFQDLDCPQISLQWCSLPPPPPFSPSDLTLVCLSVSSSPSHLTVGWVWTVSALKGLCVEAAARVILRGLLCQSQEVWGGLRSPEGPEGPAIDWTWGLGAGRAPGAGWRPGAAPSPVTVSSLSLTVCSQLDSFCPRVKAFSRQTLRCHLGGAFCRGEEMPSVP